MKNILFAALLVLGCCIALDAQTARRLNLSASLARSASVTSRDFHLKQFSAGLSLSYRLTKKWSLNAGLSKSFDERPPNLRAGLSFRLY